jgi:hypothetical protein
MHKVVTFSAASTGEAIVAYDAWAATNNHSTGIEVQNITGYFGAAQHHIVVHYFERS